MLCDPERAGSFREAVAANVDTLRRRIAGGEEDAPESDLQVLEAAIVAASKETLLGT